MNKINKRYRKALGCLHANFVDIDNAEQMELYPSIESFNCTCHHNDDTGYFYSEGFEGDLVDTDINISSVSFTTQNIKNKLANVLATKQYPKIRCVVYDEDLATYLMRDTNYIYIACWCIDIDNGEIIYQYYGDISDDDIFEILKTINSVVNFEYTLDLSELPHEIEHYFNSYNDFGSYLYNIMNDCPNYDETYGNIVSIKFPKCTQRFPSLFNDWILDREIDLDYTACTNLHDSFIFDKNGIFTVYYPNNYNWDAKLSTIDWRSVIEAYNNDDPYVRTGFIEYFANIIGDLLPNNNLEYVNTFVRTFVNRISYEYCYDTDMTRAELDAINAIKDYSIRELQGRAIHEQYHPEIEIREGFDDDIPIPFVCDNDTALLILCRYMALMLFDNNQDRYMGYVSLDSSDEDDSDDSDDSDEDDSDNNDDNTDDEDSSDERIYTKVL
jgi:hypothetical protein